jgi:hypothetical protein
VVVVVVAGADVVAGTEVVVLVGAGGEVVSGTEVAAGTEVVVLVVAGAAAGLLEQPAAMRATTASTIGDVLRGARWRRPAGTVAGSASSKVEAAVVLSFPYFPPGLALSFALDFGQDLRPGGGDDEVGGIE